MKPYFKGSDGRVFLGEIVAGDKILAVINCIVGNFDLKKGEIATVVRLDQKDSFGKGVHAYTLKDPRGNTYSNWSLPTTHFKHVEDPLTDAEIDSAVPLANVDDLAKFLGL